MPYPTPHRLFQAILEEWRASRAKLLRSLRRLAKVDDWAARLLRRVKRCELLRLPNGYRCSRFLLCASCAGVRANQLCGWARKRLSYALAMHPEALVYWVTLTQPVARDARLLCEQAGDGVRQLLGRRAAGTVLGAIWILHLKAAERYPGKFNVNVHAIVLARKRLDTREMTRVWKRATKGGYYNRYDLLNSGGVGRYSADKLLRLAMAKVEYAARAAHKPEDMVLNAAIAVGAYRSLYRPGHKLPRMHGSSGICWGQKVSRSNVM